LQILQIKEYDLKLKNLDNKIKLAKKMKSNIELAIHPDALAGQCTLIEVNKNKKCIIENLNPNEKYYVRVSCANIKGFGPFSFSNPICLIPSCNYIFISK